MQIEYKNRPQNKNQQEPTVSDFFYIPLQRD